VESFKFG